MLVSNMHPYFTSLQSTLSPLSQFVFLACLHAGFYLVLPHNQCLEQAKIRLKLPINDSFTKPVPCLYGFNKVDFSFKQYVIKTQVRGCVLKAVDAICISVISVSSLIILLGNRALKYLSVKGNRYDLGSSDNLAEMLASNNTLTSLDLGSCKLGGKLGVIGD